MKLPSSPTARPPLSPSADESVDARLNISMVATVPRTTLVTSAMVLGCIVVEDLRMGVDPKIPLP